MMWRLHILKGGLYVGFILKVLIQLLRLLIEINLLTVPQLKFSSGIIFSGFKIFLFII